VSDETSTLAGRAAALHAEFARSFAEARRPQEAEREDLLAIQVGGRPYALRLREVAGLFADRKVVPVPTRAEGLLGLIGVRGTMAPVHDLRTHLGHPGGPPPRWTVLARAPSPLALAFEEFEAHLRVAPEQLWFVENGARDHRHLRGAVRVGAVARPIVDVASVIAAITSRVQLPRDKER
jgi:chemotaxis signal transduction protein